MEIADLAAVDRDVRRAAEKLETWRRAPSKDRDPFAGVRDASTQTTYRALLAHPASMGEGLHRDALARWVHELLQARIGLDLEADEHERANERDEAVGASFSEAWAAVVRGDDAADAEALAAPVLAARRERRDRRAEAMRRLEIAAPGAAHATALFDATEPLARDLLQHAIKRKEGKWRPSDAIVLAQARDAREGWPAQLLPRWLDEVLAPLGRAKTTAFPDPLGGASFLRAAAKWGFARRLAGTPASLPFALARDPYSLPGHRFAGACAAAIADPVFGRKVLGLPLRLAEAQARALRISLLFGARTLAARVLVVSGSDPEEITVRLFGAPLFAAWPSVRIDDHARVVAALDADDFVRSLVERFDEDWFRNPRAGAHLSSIAAAPAFDDAAPPAEAAVSVAGTFERWLG